MPKAAIVMLAGTDTPHADLGRATNALTTVQEFAEAGNESTLTFDGAGVLPAGRRQLFTTRYEQPPPPRQRAHCRVGRGPLSRSASAARGEQL